MNLPKEKLNKFIEAYEKEFGVSLNEERAQEEFEKLAQLYSILYLPKRPG